MITELKPTNLIAVEMKPNACNYRIVRNKSLFFNETDEPAVPHTLELPNNYKILCEVTKDKTGFDFEPYVDKYNNGAYRDYKDNYPFYPDFDTPNICLTNEESFISLLAANGIYFENPYREPEPVIEDTLWNNDEQDTQVYAGYNYALDKWFSFENNLIKGKLLILEKL